MARRTVPAPRCVSHATGAEEKEIEASFCAAISTAREQKSVSLLKRAEATYAEYRVQKAAKGFRLPLCYLESAKKSGVKPPCALAPSFVVVT